MHRFRIADALAANDSHASTSVVSGIDRPNPAADGGWRTLPRCTQYTLSFAN